jgi:hypothetical protein
MDNRSEAAELGTRVELSAQIYYSHWILLGCLGYGPDGGIFVVARFKELVGICMAGPWASYKARLKTLDMLRRLVRPNEIIKPRRSHSMVSSETCNQKYLCPH